MSKKKGAADQPQADNPATKQAEKELKATDTAADAASELQTGPKTQQVKFLRTHPAYAYHAGEVGDLAPAHVELLIAGGFAEAVVPTEAAE